MLVYVVIFIFLVYYLVMLALIAGWYKAMHLPVGEKTIGQTTTISVLVPFRNEVAHLPVLISSLKEQSLRGIEVILVDDSSTDDSSAVAMSMIAGDSNFKLLKNSGVGKKWALNTGINAARGNVIVTTDADCTFHSNWLQEMQESFRDSNVQLAFGIVKGSRFNSLFDQIVALEFSSVVAMGISAFGLGVPLYCNGANLAFRKAVFEELGGYEDNIGIASGDDEFLFKKIASRYPAGIRFVTSEAAVVTTALPGTLASLLQQRLRWAGKWWYNNNMQSIVVALLFVLVELTVVYAMVQLFEASQPRLFLFLLGGKVIFDLVFLFQIQQFLRQRLRLLPFVLLELVHPFYLLGIGLFSRFTAYTWKGRVWKSKQ